MPSLSSHLGVEDDKRQNQKAQTNPMAKKPLSELSKHAKKLNVRDSGFNLDDLLDEAAAEDGLVSPEDDGRDADEVSP